MGARVAADAEVAALATRTAAELADARRQHEEMLAVLQAQRAQERQQARGQPGVRPAQQREPQRPSAVRPKGWAWRHLQPSRPRLHRQAPRSRR